MKTYFIVSDVHSFYNELQEALNKNGWDLANPNHILISLGDLFDRGPDSIKCLDFVIDLLNKDRLIAIRGNHEDLIQEMIIHRKIQSHDIHNGTDKTLYQLTDCKNKQEAFTKIKTNEAFYKYLDSTVNYAEIGDNIFVHGWIPSEIKIIENELFYHIPDMYKPTEERYNPDWRNASYSDWDAAVWKNGMKQWNKGIVEPNKTIWCGHWHSSWGHANLHNDGKEFINPVETFYIDPDTGRQEPHANFEPFIDNGIIAMDACVAVTHKINCKTLIIE